jgi:diaminopimelate decarboxylase
MNYFDYRGADMYCEDVPIADIAEAVGTPFYLYSYRTLIEHFRKVEEAFEEVPHLVCFSVKANSNRAVLQALREEGAGADIVSGGELYRALQAGIPAEEMVYAGIGKTDAEIRYALESGILMFNVESGQELETLSRVAGEMGATARIALRVNPDVDPHTHPYIATGLKSAKFGLSPQEALSEYEKAAALPHIEVAGIHQHIGSQITEVGPFKESLEKIGDLMDRLRQRGIEIRFLNIGGGFGIPYKGEEVPTPADYARTLTPLLRSSGCKVILETGRMIVGNAGVLVSRVLYRKSNEQKLFLVVDVAMNDLIRPSLYDSWHEILPVHWQEQREKETVDVVGPVCESGDFMARGRSLPRLEPGELLAIMSAGAYGFTMSSNYNSRLRVAEVMVRGEAWDIVKERESYADLVRGEKGLPAAVSKPAEGGEAR